MTCSAPSISTRIKRCPSPRSIVSCTCASTSSRRSVVWLEADASCRQCAERNMAAGSLRPDTSAGSTSSMRAKPAASLAIVGWRVVKDTTMEVTLGRSQVAASRCSPSCSAARPRNSRCHCSADRRKLALPGASPPSCNGEGGAGAGRAPAAAEKLSHTARRQPASSSRTPSSMPPEAGFAPAQRHQGKRGGAPCALEMPDGRPIAER